MGNSTTKKNTAGDAINRLAGALRTQSLIRIVGIPFQRIIDRAGGTHRFLTGKSVETLGGDGHTAAEAFCRDYLDEINRGNHWADVLWKNTNHHFNPRTEKGLWIWPGAVEQMTHWWRDCEDSWRRGDRKKASFMLGACLHLIQDMCQPYHSNCVVLRGHQRYERWADRNKEDFAARQCGIYDVALSPEGWTAANACFSHKYLPQIEEDSGRLRYEATRTLLTRAIRTGAGFLLFAWNRMESSPDVLTAAKAVAG